MITASYPVASCPPRSSSRIPCATSWPATVFSVSSSVGRVAPEPLTVRTRRYRAHDVVAMRDHVQGSDAWGDRILLVVRRRRQVDGQRKRQVGMCAVADRYQDALETRRALPAQHQHVGHGIFEHTFQGGIEVAAVRLLLRASRGRRVVRRARWRCAGWPVPHWRTTYHPAHTHAGLHKHVYGDGQGGPRLQILAALVVWLSCCYIPGLGFGVCRAPGFAGDRPGRCANHHLGLARVGNPHCQRGQPRSTHRVGNGQ